jgi:hypothetical protein
VLIACSRFRRYASITLYVGSLKKLAAESKEMEPILNVIGLLIAVVALYMVGVRILKSRESFMSGIQSAFISNEPAITANDFTLKPKLWWFMDDELNSRKWDDYGSRKSNNPNRGYLELALDCVRATQSANFDVRALVGRRAVSAAIEEHGGRIPSGVYQMPVALWRQWAMAGLLTHCGGLAVVGDSVLCVGPSFAPLIANVRDAVFGIDPDEIRAVPGFDVGPAPWVGWASLPHTVGWEGALLQWNEICAAGPTAWNNAIATRVDLVIAMAQKDKGVAFLQGADGGRRADGRVRTLGDILGSVVSLKEAQASLRPGTVYVPMDGDALARSAEFGWFNRMSVKQILESSFLWAVLARNVHVNMHKYTL